jgi:predicted  nucleic acid-binding Zn-ribbon protein
MWKQIFRMATKLLTLTEETERNKTEIKELRKELRELSSLVAGIVHELRRASENEAHEREKLVLRLQNEMLKFERRLPSIKPTDDRSSG